jgi:hypothetical protein
VIILSQYLPLAFYANSLSLAQTLPQPLLKSHLLPTPTPMPTLPHLLILPLILNLPNLPLHAPHINLEIIPRLLRANSLQLRLQVAVGAGAGTEVGGAEGLGWTREREMRLGLMTDWHGVQGSYDVDGRGRSQTLMARKR